MALVICYCCDWKCSLYGVGAGVVPAASYIIIFNERLNNYKRIAIIIKIVILLQVKVVIVVVAVVAVADTVSFVIMAVVGRLNSQL